MTFRLGLSEKESDPEIEGEEIGDSKWVVSICRDPPKKQWASVVPSGFP